MARTFIRILFPVLCCTFLTLLVYTYKHKANYPKITNAVSSLASKLQSQNWIAGEDGVPFEDILKGPLAQNDSRIVKRIRDACLLPPSTEPYNLKSPKIDPSMGQSSVVKKIFENKTGGVFIECGGYDGETRSNTLSLEKDFGWKGVLIEGGRNNFNILKTKNRKAWMANACLSVQVYPQQVFFSDAKNVGKISKTRMGKPTQCFPLYSILSAVGFFEIDYFSLDVEGNELQVLNTIPFDSVSIKVLSVEYLHTPGSADLILKFMHSKGYREVTRVINKMNLAHDLILVHKSVIVKEPFPAVIKT